MAQTKIAKLVSEGVSDRQSFLGFKTSHLRCEVKSAQLGIGQTMSERRKKVTKSIKI